MTRVFVDTSAMLALLVPSDTAHRKAARAFDGLRRRSALLATTSYVLVETYALLAARFGLDAVRRFRLDFAPLLEVIWVGLELHEGGLDLQLERGRKSLSLVDCVSLLAIRSGSFDQVFALDPDLRVSGVALIP